MEPSKCINCSTSIWIGVTDKDPYERYCKPCVKRVKLLSSRITDKRERQQSFVDLDRELRIDIDRYL